MQFNDQRPRSSRGTKPGEERERERKDAAVAKERSVLVFCSVPRPAPAMTHRPLPRRTSTDYKDLNTGLLPNI